MSLSTRVGGVWRDIRQIFSYIPSSGWRPMMEAYVKAGGVWELVHENFTADLTIGTPGGDFYGFLQGSYGSIAPDSLLVPTTGVVLTIKALGYGANFSDGNPGLRLVLEGSSAPANSDSIYTRILVNSVEYTRSLAVETFVIGNTRTWTWIDSNEVGTSGIANVEFRWD